jgi:thiamine biosynthesis lipoprotein
MQMRIILTNAKDNQPWACTPVRNTASSMTASPLTESAAAKRLRISLGTLVAVEAIGGCAAAAEAAVEAAFAAIGRVHHRMHPHSADSDLARINNAPANTRFAVHPSILELLDFAQRLNSITDGVFDPCLPTRPGRLQDIEVSTEHVLCHVPVALDFGGFAKGFAVDRAIETLISHGCTAGLVNAGGDLRVFGPRTEPIFVRGPTGELTEVRLVDGALAVSDADSQHRPAEHQGYYVRNRGGPAGRGAGGHNAEGRDVACHSGAGRERDVDDHCRTGRNPLVTHYAAVIAREAMVADALSKCVLMCTPAIAARTLRAFDATQVASQ